MIFCGNVNLQARSLELAPFRWNCVVHVLDRRSLWDRPPGGLAKRTAYLGGH